MDLRYDEAIFPTDLPLALASIALERGLRPEQFCRGLGFSVDDLGKPATRLSFRQASPMIHRALAAISDPALGLTLGAQSTLGSMGTLGHAMAMSPTVGEAVKLAIEHLVLTGALGLRIKLRSYGALIWLELDHVFLDPLSQAFIAEEAFASTLTYLRALCGRPVRPVQVDFAHADRGSGRFAREFFGAPVNYECHAHRFIVEAQLMNLPVPSHHTLGLRRSLDLLETLSRQERTRFDLCNTVEHAACRNLAAKVAIEDIARELNMSSRTLRRRLATEGVSFETLVENARKTLAINLLANSDVSIERVAGETGYSDVRSFRRAFRRWTGASPHEYRTSEPQARLECSVAV